MRPRTRRAKTSGSEATRGGRRTQRCTIIFPLVATVHLDSTRAETKRACCTTHTHTSGHRKSCRGVRRRRLRQDLADVCACCAAFSLSFFFNSFRLSQFPGSSFFFVTPCSSFPFSFPLFSSVCGFPVPLTPCSPAAVEAGRTGERSQVFQTGNHRSHMEQMKTLQWVLLSTACPGHVATTQQEGSRLRGCGVPRCDARSWTCWWCLAVE